MAKNARSPPYCSSDASSTRSTDPALLAHRRNLLLQALKEAIDGGAVYDDAFFAPASLANFFCWGHAESTSVDSAHVTGKLTIADPLYGLPIKFYGMPKKPFQLYAEFGVRIQPPLIGGTVGLPFGQGILGVDEFQTIFGSPTTLNLHPPGSGLTDPPHFFGPTTHPSGNAEFTYLFERRSRRAKVSFLTNADGSIQQISLDVNVVVSR